MSNKKILMAVANYYTSPFQVGSHHFARAFARLGYDVLFISNPISPIHSFFANNQDFKERERIYKKHGENESNIFYYVPKSIFTPQNKPFLSSKFVLNNWHKFTSPNLLNFIRKHNFSDVDILWFDSPLFGFLLDEITYKRSILRIADYSKGFSSVSINQFQKETDIANRVDKVVYTAKNLKDKYSEILDKSKMLYVSNGLDADFFKNADRTFPDEFSDIPSPRVIYIGAIHEWFDDELIYYCAKKMPEHNFILIGSLNKDISKLNNLKNVYILGPKPYSRICQFLSNSDVGIIPFNVVRCPALVNSINPLKLYEYLACDLPVVSTRWEQIENMKDYICMTQDKDIFLNFIKYPEKNSRFNIQKLSWLSKAKYILRKVY
ncbi:glycosyltransferase family protein [Campylobacter sp. MOP51]|uniref:GumK N-terminal domain-containing glycosyltransferase n=1 Tax=Campylobacter canis TaxID=3378588 RepID=UPI003C4F962F